MFKHKILHQPWEAAVWFDEKQDVPEADDTELEDEEDVENEDENEDEYETEFEAKLAKEHPELLDEYRQNNAGLLSALRKERTGNKEATKKVKAFEDKEAARQREKQTKEENLQSDLDAAEARAVAAEEKLQKALVREVAVELKFQNPADAALFVDMSSLDLGDDDKANRKAIEGALKQVAKERPYLVKKTLSKDGNEDDNDKDRKLDDDPETKKKIKAGQPKIAI